MDALVARLRRHPIVLVLCLVATVGGCAAVWSLTPVEHEVTNTYAVLPPSSARDVNGKAVAVNPWQEAGGLPAQIAASALEQIGDSRQFQDALAARGVASTTKVEVGVGGGGVVLEVSTKDTSAAVASRDAIPLAQELSTALLRQQQAVGAPQDSYLRLQELTGPAEPVVLTAGRLRPTAVAAALGLLVTLLAVVAADSRRRPVSAPAAAPLRLRTVRTQTCRRPSPAPPAVTTGVPSPE